MNARRRYDTTALIQDLKTDRRKGLGLTVTAALVVLVVVGIYIFQLGGGTPEVPEEATPAELSTEEKQKNLEGAIVKEEPALPEPKPSAPEPAWVEISLQRKGQLWIDDEQIGKLKKHEVELSAGLHRFKVKFGRKLIEHEETLPAGSKVQMLFQPRKKKAAVTVLEAGEGSAEEEVEANDQ